MYVLGGFLSSVGDAIMDGIRTFMLTLCDGIYRLIYMTYFMFEKLGTAKIITDDQIAGIFRRVGLIIGIFMLFRLTFAFIQYIVDPDAMTDNKKGMGNIIKKILISIILLGSTSTLFNLAFKVQNLIIDNHIISKVIFNSNAGASDDFGAELSAEVFTSFFRLNPDATGTDAYCAPLITNDSSGKSVIYNSIAKNNGELTEAYKCITDKDKNGEYIATFDGGGFIALVVGAIVLYILLTYTIQVGVRVIQLAYLQIIAPVPIMMYITPQGEDKLKKWGQQCLTTFLDFFLRTMIIYFAIFVLQNIWENDTISTILTAGHSNSNNWQTAYIGVIIIIAVLVFTKKVPNLIKEIFPALEGAAGFSYSLKMPEEAKKVGLFGAGAALGAAGAAASNLLYGAGSIRKNWKESEGTTGQKLWQATKGVFGTGASVIGGAASGLNKGRKIKDLKGVKSVVQQTNDNRDKRDLKQAAGYTVKDSILDSISGFAGLDTKAEGMIKEAQWQQQAAESSRGAIWKSAEEAVRDHNLSYDSYSFIRSLKQSKDAYGKVQWIGLSSTGQKITIDDANLATEIQGMASSPEDIAYMNIHSEELAKAVRDNAGVDKRIKDEGKKIKGLEAAKNDAKK